MIIFGCSFHGLETIYEQIVHEKQKTGNFIRARKLWNTNRVYDFENYTLLNEKEKRPVGVILGERLNFYKEKENLITITNAGMLTANNIPVLLECWKDYIIIEINQTDNITAVINDYVKWNISDYENKLPNFSIPMTKLLDYKQELIKFKTLSSLISNKITIKNEEIVNPNIFLSKLKIEQKYQNLFVPEINTITNPVTRCINYSEVFSIINS